MASTYFTRSSLLNMAKANIIPRFTSLSFPQKASRVCFTSASKHSQGKRVSQESNSGYNGHESDSYSDMYKSENAKHKMEQGKDRMKEGAHEMKEVPMDGMKEANEKVKHKATEMKDKTKDMASNAADRAGEMKENVKGKANEMAGRAADRAGEMKE
nr:hypothetical protein [Tanacetum cinerariifolium]GEZ38476.1 hypothetical protein [Tanacetum cinerariifolium]